METTLRKYIANQPNTFFHFRVNVKWKVNNIIVKCEVSNKVNHGLVGNYNEMCFVHVECASKFSDHYLSSKLLQEILYVDIIHEMNITFISNLDDMTYSHYLTVPKQMIE